MSTMRADIAIVGAGIVGCMIARETITRAPKASVVVLDRDAVGSGASRRSAGLHCPRGSTARVRHMTRYSQDYYAKLKESASAFPIHQLAMSVVASAGSAPQLREIYLDSAKLTRTDGVPGDDIRVPEDAEAWSGDGCQYADVYALAQALARELRPRVSLREGVGVEAVDETEKGIALRLSTGETVTAGQIVLAPGPWLAAPAWKELVAPLGARVKKVVALHIEQAIPTDGRVVFFQDEDAFLLPLSNQGYWLYSYTCKEWDVDPDSIANGLSPNNVEEARESLHRYAPMLADRCTSGRVFCDAYSRTGEPLVQVLHSGGRIVFAGATNGAGYRLAPAIASEAADLLQLPRSQS
jgi:glycine/D-amino acid oxidase-like deaminating enzyme